MKISAFLLDVKDGIKGLIAGDAETYNNLSGVKKVELVALKALAGIIVIAATALALTGLFGTICILGIGIKTIGISLLVLFGALLVAEIVGFILNKDLMKPIFFLLGISVFLPLLPGVALGYIGMKLNEISDSLVDKTA